MRYLRLHRPLMLTALLMAVLTLVSIGGLLFDDRVLTGVPIWLKPLKFSISLAIYTVTLAWLISLIQPGTDAGRVRGRARLAWWFGTVVVAATIIEMTVIVGQVVRGQRSHFNVGTALDATLYSLMGMTIVILWVATAGIGVLLLRERIADRATALAIRLGLLVALGGLSVGFLMTSPTPEQVEGMADAPPTVVGAHSVGVADGGPGLPLVNWSTTGGDLRVGHFIGMHALQALPLLALGLTIAGRRLGLLRDDRMRARFVIVAAAAYGGLTALLTWQALRGQALIHPDGLTWAAALGLLAATAAGMVWALARPAAVTVTVT